MGTYSKGDIIVAPFTDVNAETASLIARVVSRATGDASTMGVTNAEIGFTYVKSSGLRLASAREIRRAIDNGVLPPEYNGKDEELPPIGMD